MKTCPTCRLRYTGDENHCLVDGTLLVELTDPRIGSELSGRYRIEEVIGRGGMATVYRAHQWRVGNDIAIKVMHERFARDANARERVEREAASTAQLAHPNIVEVYDVGQTEDDVPYIAMELLNGKPLDQVIQRRKAIPIRELVGLALQCARGLSRAHDFDVVHRDIKPENLFVCMSDDRQPVVKIVDFGISHAQNDSRLTGGDIIGSPRYMAPERLRDRERVIMRSDLYSLGVVLFEAATGTLPFESESLAGFILHHLETPPPRLRDRVANCPPAFDELVDELLAKDADARPSDAHVVVARLSEMASDGAKRVRRVSVFTTENRTATPSPIERWKSRVKLYGEMVHRVHGDAPPADLGETLAEFHASLGRLTALQHEGAKIERGMVEHSESMNRDRERVGHAVETLAKDLSRARERKRGVEHARAYQHALAQLIDLDRNSPDAPVPESLVVLADARRHYQKWLEAHQASGETDLAFQLAALRERLDRLEAERATARADATLALTENGRERASIEERLIRHAQTLGAAFRAEPQVQDLLRQLRSG